MRIIEESGRPKPDMATLPLDDPKTYEMMARGDSVGVFQFESDGMRDALRKVRPTEFEDLVALNALYRPGAMRHIDTSARNKRMPDEVHPNGLSSVYLHPASAAVLRIVPWREGGPGVLGFEYLYPLHIGELGGPWHRVLTAATGLALFLLGASGVWLWWKRGRRLF